MVPTVPAEQDPRPQSPEAPVNPPFLPCFPLNRTILLTANRFVFGSAGSRIVRWRIQDRSKGLGHARISAIVVVEG